jgi:NADPH:quinone reductase-like Zn-dependent oxidoreductase
VRAAFVTEIGPPEAIVVDDLPEPTRGPTDVLVAVEVSTVNQVDTYIRAGGWSTPIPFPFILGRDLVGTVIAADPVTGFGPGDRVWCNSLGHAGRQGACAERAVVSVERLYRLPDGVEPRTFVASLHAGATAFLGLHHRAHLRAGETVLVGGGAGSIGSAAVRLAAAAGARVIATARPGDHGHCRGLGADEVFDYADPALTDALLAAAPDGVDLYWDTSGTAAVVDATRLIAPGGRMLLSAGRSPQPAAALWPVYTNDISVIGFVISRASATELADAADAINRHMVDGGLGISVAHVFPLDETAKAHALVESGTPGRIVIDIAP